MTPAAVLRAAAALIEQRGHWKRANIGPENQCCVVQAIWASDSSRELAAAAKERLRSHLGLHVLEPFHEPLLLWNDHPSRTQADVLQALRQAAGDE